MLHVLQLQLLSRPTSTSFLSIEKLPLELLQVRQLTGCLNNACLIDLRATVKEVVDGDGNSRCSVLQGSCQHAGIHVH